MAKFQQHLFVCTHDRGPDGRRASCAQRGSLEIAAALKAQVYDRGLKRIVRVNKSGCLDQCERGVTAVVYPKGIWYGSVTLDDVDELVNEQLVAGRTVERLVIPDGQLTGIEVPAGDRKQDEQEKPTGNPGSKSTGPGSIHDS